ncbi:MAG: type 4a pilus biogenesis protein PilO [Xanthomonadales bacterium]|jgi:type IV pilus assembly protein PilO|nr:type 4a pilus biogenesis protein PilO [Xanthomonadales bacterium]MBK7144547.1 type 4a pilus biogenesis protein PilO [Xanthomonadales bacterium]
MKLSDINNLDAKNYGSWPLPIKFLAAFLLFAVVVAAGIFMKIKPANDELEVLRAKELELVSVFTEKQGKVVNLEEYKKQLEEMRELLRQMIRQLPSKTEMPDLLIDVSQTALSSGIDNELFEPGPEVAKEFYAEKPITLRMKGTYHQFGAFVSGVASLPRVVILTMHDVSLTPVDKAATAPGGKAGAASSSSGSLVLEGTVKTYRYLDEDELSAVSAETTSAGAGAATSARPAQ